MTATFTAAGSVIDSFQCYQHHYYSTSETYKERTYWLNCVSIPCTDINKDTITYSISGSTVRDHLIRISFMGSIVRHHGGYDEVNYVTTNWNSISNPPQIVIKF